MTPAELHPVIQAIAAYTDAMLILVFVTMGLGHLAGRFVGDLVRFGLMQWPRYRAWIRKRNRIERLEFAAYLEARRAAIEAKSVAS